MRALLEVPFERVIVEPMHTVPPMRVPSCSSPWTGN
jgi:hypothetical protein